MAMERLISLVQDEQACVTVKSLAYELQIPSHQSKLLLNALVSKGATSHLAVTYFLSGISNNALHIKLVNGLEAVEAAKKSFDKVTAVHVYAVEQTRAKEGISSQSLWNSDQRKLQQEVKQGSSEEVTPFQSNKFGAVICKGVDVKAPRRPNNVASGAGKASFSRHATSSKTKSAITPKEFFASKNTGKGKAKDKKAPAKSAKSFFAGKKKASAGKEVEKAKPETKSPAQAEQDKEEKDMQKPSQKRARNVIDSDSEDEEIEYDDSEEREFGEPAPKKKRSKKKKKVEMTEEERAHKEAERKELARQKREERKMEIDKEKEARRKEEAQEAKTRFAESLGCKKQESEENPKRTKFVKKLVEKQYVDGKGYLVTEEVMEEVEVEIDSKEEADSAKSKIDSHQKSDTSKKGPDKRKGNMKKASTKQANIHSFFKKKK